MLDVILEILSIIGIILLILLGIVFILLLLILFFPITYRFFGKKGEDILVKAKAKWLFGFLRVCYDYPEPSALYVKVLWFTLFRKKIPPDDQNPAEQSSLPEESVSTAENHIDSEEIAIENASDSANPEIENTVPVSQDEISVDANEVIVQEDQEEISQKKGFFQKIEQIKYTILNIYDKIKEIWNHITYYVELLKEENTKALFRHMINRVAKILKSIRPRHIKANILFGTGSPDTTGYAYGVYGMLSAGLGPDFIVEPDFEQAVLKGEIFLSGHITIWVLLINALKVFFDPKLHLFIKKVKAGMPEKKK